MSARHGQPPTPFLLDAAWLAAWRQDVEAVLARLLPGFEDLFGYPPGENTIQDPDPDGMTAAQRLAAHPGVAAVLPRLCRRIGKVVLADVGNGYFIHSAVQVLRDLADSGATPLGDAGEGTFFDAHDLSCPSTAFGSIHSLSKSTVGSVSTATYLRNRSTA